MTCIHKWCEVLKLNLCLDNLYQLCLWVFVKHTVFHLSIFHKLFLCLGEVKNSVILDREVTPNYQLVAQATDGGGQWCWAEVKLMVTDVNDNPPIFTLSQYTLSVYEDTVPKALLTRFQAIDPDEGNAIAISITAVLLILLVLLVLLELQVF